MVHANHDPVGKPDTGYAIGWVGRGWRLALGGVVGAAFFAPIVGTFASSAPATPRTFVPAIHAIPVHPFQNLNTGSCIPGLPLHVGPIQQVGHLVYPGEIEERMRAAVSECSTALSGGVALGVTVDVDGQITQITNERGDDQVLVACATRLLHRNPLKETRGPGSLRVGFFMGQAEDLR